MGESSFWYRPTRVVPDQRPLNGRCCCCTSTYLTAVPLNGCKQHLYNLQQTETEKNDSVLKTLLSLLHVLHNFRILTCHSAEFLEEFLIMTEIHRNGKIYSLLSLYIKLHYIMYRKCCRDTTCTQCGKNCQSVVLIFFHTLAQLFNGPLSRTTQVGRYQKKHSPTHTHPDHQTSFINFLHLLRSIASSLCKLHA